MLFLMSALLVTLNSLTENAPVPAGAAVSVKPQVECCGDDCQCCDMCPCGCAPKIPSVKPAKADEVVSPKPPREFGNIQIINGLAHKLTERWQEGGNWKYLYVPINSPQASRVASTPASSYQPRWANYDGLSRVQHAQAHHGLNPSSMSESELYRQMDTDHDRYGAGHSQILRARQSQPMMRPGSSCPDGVCPQPRRISRGLFW